MLKDTDFLKVENYIEDEYPITCIITERGLGKTHSSLELAAKTVANKAKFVVTRLTMEAFKKFKDDIEQNMEGWKCSVAGQNIKKDGETIAYLSSLNTYANAKGGTYNDVEFMVFDEFNEDIYIENAYTKFVLLVDSFKRHRKNFKCVLLGNMVNKNNWFLNAMGLRPNWKAKEDLIYYLPEYGVKVVIIGSETFNKLNKERQQINKLASADPNAHAFYNQREFINDHTDFVTNFRKWVEPTFKPLFHFRKGQFKYLFGTYKETDGQQYFFVDRYNIFYERYGNLQEFSFDAEGNIGSKTTTILEDEDIEDMQMQLFKIAKSEKLRYGSFDAFEDLQRFIALGSLMCI